MPQAYGENIAELLPRTAIEGFNPRELREDRRRKVSLSMHTRLFIAGALLGMAALPVAAPVSAQTPAASAPAGIHRMVMQQNGSGQSGEVVLYPRGAKTFVVLTVQNAPAGSVEPAHVHRGSDCASLDPAPAFALHNVVNGTSQTLVAAPITALLSGNYVVNVHESAANLKHYVACGALIPGA